MASSASTKEPLGKRPADVEPDDLAQIKRQKTTSQLRDHLPELSDESSIYGDTDLSEIRRKILKKAKKRNTLGLLPRQTDIEPIYYDFFEWSVALSKAENASGETKNAAFIIERESSIEAHGQYIGNRIPGISCSTNVFGKPKKEARRADVVIVTAPQFLKALSQGIIKMQQFHSLVIQDAQNTRNMGCHSYLPIVQVMNNFYLTTSSSSRPRIFAIALLSNLSSRALDSSLMRLESTLLSKAYGVPKDLRKELSTLSDRPSECVVLYDSPAEQRPPSKSLHKRLLEIDPGMKTGRQYFQAAEDASSELGPAAGDLTWKFSLKEIQDTIPAWYEDDNSDSAESMRVRIRNAIMNWSFAMPNLNPSAPGFNVTHKFLRLVQVLEACATYGEAFSCIVFVQHRSTAQALTEFLRMIGDKLSFIRPAAATNGLDITAQLELFTNFANGRYNLLVATKSFEDLGLPESLVVIRFNLFDGQISHAFARACTRGKESQLIHLVERNNDTERQVLGRSTVTSTALTRWSDTFNRSPRIGVPPERVTGSSHTYLDNREGVGSEQDEGTSTYLTHPTTGGRVYPEHAVSVLLGAASRLQAAASGEQSIFDFQLILGNKIQTPSFTCSINLPGTAADGSVGPPAPNQYLARRYAAFEACRKLLEIGRLDHEVVPLPPSLALHRGGLEQLNVAKLAGTRRYLRQQPFFWTHGNTGQVKKLYPTVILVGSKSDKYSPLALLTRQPLPSLMDFNLFLSGDTLRIKTIRGSSFEATDEETGKLHGFTTRLFKSLLNKPLSCTLEDTTYLLAPLLRSWEPESDDDLQMPDIACHLNWELMEQVESKWAVPINKDSPNALKADMVDAIVQDRWLEFTRRYHVVRVREDLTPLSKPDPTDREAEHETYVDFVKANRKGFEGLKDNDQPLLEVDRVLSILNNLSPRVKDLTPPSRAAAKYLIPELCGRFLFPSSMFRTVLLIPSIMWKIDDLLVVKEMNNRFFQNSIREDLLSEALTTVSAGMEQDYERLELLGDSFLKYVSSLFVFVANSTQNEGSLHVTRQQILSNKALLQASTRVNTIPYIRSTLFNIRLWMPPNFVTLSLPGKDKPKGGDGAETEQKAPTDGGPHGSQRDEVQVALDLEVPVPDDKMQVDSLVDDKEHKEEDGSKTLDANPKKKKKPKKAKKTGEDGGVLQTLGDKTIADVAEAITGAAYVSGGRECALNVLKVLTVPIPGINTWADFGARVVIPLPHRVAQLRSGSVQQVEKIIGHKFRQPHLLSQAMTHTSVKTSGMTSYERLEFVGDAILDFMVIRYIYDRDHALSPGGLTLLKSAMVSNSTLAAICVSSGLHEHLLFESQQLAHNIQDYARVLKRKAEEEYRNAETERRPAGQFWVDIEPPKALSDVVESIIGAVYVSDNFSPIGAEAFFDNVLRPFFDKHITLQTLTHHPTNTLFELVQAHCCQMMKMTRESKDGATVCHVLIHEEILATSTGTSPSNAARQASVLALEVIKSNANALSRICDCRGRAKDKNTWMAQGFSQALSSLTGESSEAQ